MDVPAPLDRQVGPFTIGGWLLIGGAGVGLGLVIRQSPFFSGDALDEEEAAPDGGDGSTPLSGPYSWVSGIVGLAQGATYGTGTGTTGQEAETADVTDNEAWLRRALAYLTSQKITSGTAADSALRKYLYGHPMTDGDRRIVDLVLERFGAPPEGTAPIEEAEEEPAPKPVDLYPGSRRHKTKAGQTWANIALITYAGGKPGALDAQGRPAKAMGVARMRQANPALFAKYPDPDQRLPAGLVVILP